MSELLPADELEDVLAYHNPSDPNNPRIRVVPAGVGKEIVKRQKAHANAMKEQVNKMRWAVIAIIIIAAVAIGWTTGRWEALFLGIIAAVFVGFIFFARQGKDDSDFKVPKLLIEHKPRETPPFEDATGAHAGALLGDVKHDPFQSGGLETPAHDRVEVGAIHKAHKGVLFLDELNLLKMESQQSLLTALQEKEFAIVGQSERSSGAMVKSDPVPCDFILVAAGNLDSIRGMHPALRSRIRGYGYEVYVKSTMDDTRSNRRKLLKFIAQEVAKDKKIPHFNRGATAEILMEAQRRSGRRGQLSLRFRELGGLIRVAGDIATEKDSPIVMGRHVRAARQIARSLEQQVADRMILNKKEYDDIVNRGEMVGMVNGLGVIGVDTGISELSGIVMRIAAEITPAQSREEGKIIATGRLGRIAREAVQNVSALIKKHTGEDITQHDIHIQFIGTYEGVEGDSASISVAAAVISAMEGIAVDQSVAMTGSLSIRGQVLPVGGITAKIEAAAESGMKKVIIPGQNMNDILIQSKYHKMIEILPAFTLRDVLESVLVGPSPRKTALLEKLARIAPADQKEAKDDERGAPGGMKKGGVEDKVPSEMPMSIESPSPGGV
jgi:Lon-like ATP-dependent protease